MKELSSYKSVERIDKGDDEGSHGSLGVESSQSFNKKKLQIDPSNDFFSPFCLK